MSSVQLCSPAVCRPQLQHSLTIHLHTQHPSVPGTPPVARPLHCFFHQQGSDVAMGTHLCKETRSKYTNERCMTLLREFHQICSINQCGSHCITRGQVRNVHVCVHIQIMLLALVYYIFYTVCVHICTCNWCTALHKADDGPNSNTEYNY